MALVVQSPDLDLERVPSGLDAYEIRSFADGSGLLIGVRLGQDLVDGSRPRVGKNIRITLYSSPWENARHIAAVPLGQTVGRPDADASRSQKNGRSCHVRYGLARHGQPQIAADGSIASHECMATNPVGSRGRPAYTLYDPSDLCHVPANQGHRLRKTYAVD